MRLIELQPPDALDALAVEEAVLEAVNSGGSEPAWLIWTAPARCAVLGTARPAEGDLYLENLRSDGAGIFRRRSGGGTVLLGPECPVVTMVERLAAPGAGSIRDSYRAFCEVLIAALRRAGVEPGFEPPADLACGGRKLAGMAQRRKRAAVLVTASVLAEPLAGPAGRYLREPGPKDAPGYRAGRSHDRFMTSLAELGLRPAAGAFCEALRAELAARGAARGELRPAERERSAVLQAELAKPGWLYRF